MSITSDYVDLCLSFKYEDLPSKVVEYVKRLGLDFIGTAAYGTLADSSKIMLEFIRSLNLHGDCTVIGTNQKYPPRRLLWLFAKSPSKRALEEVL